MTKTLVIGIPTFNRMAEVYSNARSLCSCNLPSWCTLNVIDDCSSEYDLDFLREVYPLGTKYERRQLNSGGADFAIYDLFSRLQETESDFMMLLDSDFVVSKDFIQTAINSMNETDGVLSLFNTPSHKVIGAIGSFVLKKTIGSAATLWTRELALEVLTNVPIGEDWDWRFCEYLNRTGRRIFVTRNSLVQHLGHYNGQNSVSYSGDLGIGFTDKDIYNAYLLIEGLMFSNKKFYLKATGEISKLRSELFVLRKNQ